MNDDQKFLEKLFRKHAASAALSMLGVQCCLMVNAILAGKFFRADGLAVMGVAAPIFSMYSAIGALSCIGGSIVASHALGRDDQSAANRTFFCALVLCLGLSIVFSLVGLTFQSDFLRLLGCSDRIFDAARSYTTIYMAGGTFIALYYMPYHFLKLTGRLNALIILFLGMTIENFAFDWILCRDFLMGIEGIALGTIAAAALTVLLGMISLRRDFRPERGNEFRAIIDVGMPSALNNAVTFLRSTLMNNLLTTTAGSSGLVLFSVVTTLENLSIIILAGISQATSAFVGMFFQERDHTSLRRLERQAHTISLKLIVPLIVGVWIFSDAIASAFGIIDPEQRRNLIEAIRIFSLSLIPSSACMILSSYYQSTKFLGLANVINLARGFVLLLIPAYVLAPRFGLDGIWWAFSIAAWGTLIVLAIILFVEHRAERSSILLLDRRSERSGTSITFAVKNTVEDISDNVRSLVEFCERNRLTRKETMMVRLSIEEMLVSLSEHCFESDAREIMNVRIVVDVDSIVLRIRNGGRIFNPIDYYEYMARLDPLEFAMSDALGIAMISKAAYAVHYKSTLGINNLTVCIERKDD